MAINWTTLQVQLAQELRILRKREAAWINFKFADNANYDKRLYVAANAYSTSVNEEANALSTGYAHLDGVQVPGMAALWSAYRGNIENEKGFFGILANDIELLSDSDKAAGAIAYVYTDTDGVIAISERNGYWGALRRQMLAEGYYIVANGVTYGTFTAANGNVGTLAATSMSGANHQLTGTLIFECVDDTVDAPKLSVRLKYTTPWPDGTEIVEADNLLECEKSFEDGPTGLTTVLTRSGLASPTEAGDDGNMFSSSAIATPAEADSNKGKIYIKVTRQAVSPIWLIQWYRTDALLASDLVQQATTDTTAGTYSVDMTGAGGQRFTSTFNRANADAHLASAGNSDSDITFDIGSPRLGDKWTRVATNDEAGVYATKLAHAWHVSLPNAGATAQFTDANANSVSMS